MEQGLIHIYCGDGKGKTSAAIGLAVRAAGSGLKVLFTRFKILNLPENWRFSMIFLRLKYFILKSLMAFLKIFPKRKSRK